MNVIESRLEIDDWMQDGFCSMHTWILRIYQNLEGCHRTFLHLEESIFNCLKVSISKFISYELCRQEFPLFCIITKHSIQCAPILTVIFGHYHAVNYLMMLWTAVSSLNVIAKHLRAMILFTLLPHYYHLSHYFWKNLEDDLKWLRFSCAIASALSSD